MSNYPLLLEPEDLLPHLSDEDLLIIDQSKAETYLNAHMHFLALNN
jgi:hypothetical protein